MDKVAVVRVRGEEGASWKVMEMMRKEQYNCERCGNNVAAKDQEKKKFREDAQERKGKQECRASGMNPQPGSTASF